MANHRPQESIVAAPQFGSAGRAGFEQKKDMDKITRKNIKKIQKEIEKLKRHMNKVELQPCHGDAELKEKEQTIKALKREIYELETEANQFAMFVSGKPRDT